MNRRVTSKTAGGGQEWEQVSRAQHVGVGKPESGQESLKAVHLHAGEHVEDTDKEKEVK